ncbi:hypothetical protein RND81_03G058700 [Saponaria officinalis]|uniref:Protein FAR1-RELATED SEQUENCE n=1 Tax=Saponaria officinalis TaxID=3572 RepID=A0AAW1LYL9_SAPOF
MNLDLNDFPPIEQDPNRDYVFTDNLDLSVAHQVEEGEYTAEGRSRCEGIFLDGNDEDDFVSEGESESINDDETTTTDPSVSHLPQVSIVPHDFDIFGSLVGVTSSSWVELYDLYKQHSRSVGFSVRKSTTRRRGGPNGIVTEKYFLCSCEGKPKSKKSSKARENDGSLESGKKSRKRVASTQTSCEAFLRLKLGFKRRESGRGEHESTGKGYVLVLDVYEIVSHVVAHNHILTPRRWHHHHRSERRISQEEGALIEVMTDARVPAAVQYRFLSTSCGGDENIRHTQKNHFNFVNRLKMKAIEGGDAQTVIEMLQKRQAEDPCFFFRFMLDDNCRVTHLFWRDSMMKEDYLLYHDVIIFDTTYRTNKYNLICGAFVGINNHWSNVMFGCAFLSDEKTESFEWLFETFNESMGGNVFPISIFTDQDQAMSNAIEKEMVHCVKQRFFFSAGILSSQRSESTNHAIGFHASKNTSLTDFYAIFNETVKRWRREEERSEFQCSRSTPTSFFHMGGLLQHASEVYTHTLFREFEKEFGITMSTQVFVVAKKVEAGLLCFHSIRVLHLHSVSKIPEKYICTRWTKYAKYEVWKRAEQVNAVHGEDNATKNWRCLTLRKFHNLITKCLDHKAARELLDAAYERQLQEVQDLLRRLQQEPNTELSSSNIVLDPPRSITKGRSQRRKWPSKHGKRRRKATVVNKGQQTATYVTPPRLI